MAKLIRVETDYRFYAAELTDEQLELWNHSEKAQDEIIDEVCDNFEFIKDKDGGTEYYIEE